MVEVVVDRLGVDSSTNSYVVILRERYGRRILPIWIGTPEAESIVIHINQHKRERPLTHDLCKALIMALGGTLRRVTISRVHDNTYYAELHLDRENARIEVDARPSDSIAIALRLDAPIFAHESLLVSPDGDEGDESDAPPSAPPADDMSSTQLQAYLAALRPEDFGKFKP
ncbi:MAG: bifunctional nuclease family protein [Gemmatimonadaceae bacterium]|nr:bifunctional nuclease family protein [Gemmatimonadaceae bacterium]